MQLSQLVSFLVPYERTTVVVPWPQEVVYQQLEATFVPYCPFQRGLNGWDRRQYRGRIEDMGLSVAGPFGGRGSHLFTRIRLRSEASGTSICLISRLTTFNLVFLALMMGGLAIAVYLLAGAPAVWFVPIQEAAIYAGALIAFRYETIFLKNFLRKALL
jgi:hypothetical protein